MRAFPPPPAAAGTPDDRRVAQFRAAVRLLHCNATAGINRDGAKGIT
jgi:hypothetical protein